MSIAMIYDSLSNRACLTNQWGQSSKITTKRRRNKTGKVKLQRSRRKNNFSPERGLSISYIYTKSPLSSLRDSAGKTHLPVINRRKMDESWKMRMGMTDLPRRRSTEETSINRPKQSVFGSDFKLQDPEDFSDVFGGPPRSVLWRQCSGDIKPRTRSDSFYEEIFQTPESIAPTRSGRNLPVFRIPARRGGLQRSEVFYSDVFGSVEDRRSRSRSKSKTNSKSKSKSNSSSVLSSEDMSPLRPAISDDIGFSSFASKLRYSTILINHPAPFTVSSSSWRVLCYVENAPAVFSVLRMRAAL